MSKLVALSPWDRAERLRGGLAKYAGDLRLVSFEEEGVLGRYYLRGSWWSWVEVVVLRGGHLLVHGDVDAVIFGYCHGHTSPRHVVQWMAFAGYSYAEEKASIGSSGKICTEFDPEVALWRVLDWRRQQSITKEEARDLFQGLQGGWSQYEFQSELHDVFDDGEVLDAGEATDRRVFVAQTVLRRLDHLLDCVDFRRRSAEWFRRCA